MVQKISMSLFDTHFSISVVSFFELQMFSSLAAKVQPLALQPFHGGFSCQVGGVDLGYESDIRSCHSQATVNSHDIIYSDCILRITGDSNNTSIHLCI